VMIVMILVIEVIECEALHSCWRGGLCDVLEQLFDSIDSRSLFLLFFEELFEHASHNCVVLLYLVSGLCNRVLDVI